MNKKNVEIFGTNSTRQKQIAAIFIIFTEVKMLDRQSPENIVYSRAVFAFLLQLILFGWSHAHRCAM